MSKVYRYPLQLRFRDTDGLGHINNAVYHTYLEMCRTQWLDDALDLGVFTRGQAIPIILARTEMDFLRQGHLNDKLFVELSLVHIGDKSFHQRYEIKTEEHTFAVGKAVLVWFDFAANRSVSIPADKRALMQPYLSVAPKS